MYCIYTLLGNRTRILMLILKFFYFIYIYIYICVLRGILLFRGCVLRSPNCHGKNTTKPT